MMRRVKLILLLLCCVSTSVLVTAQAENYSFIKNTNILFDENGNGVEDVLFLGIQPNLNIQVRQNGFSYDTYADKVAPSKDEEGNIDIVLEERKFHRIDFDFVNSNNDVTFEYVNTNSNLFRYNGNEKSLFQLTKKVIAKNIYPQVDVEYVFQGKDFKYNIVLNPGANISDVILNVSGQEGLKLEDNQLKINTTNGLLTENIPASFYLDNGKEVQIKYLLENGQIKFAADGIIENDRTFIIDPTGELALEWGTYSGGLEDDEYGQAIVDGLGFVYMAGDTDNNALMATAGAYQTTFGSGTSCALIQKFDLDGNLIWGSYYGGAPGGSSSFKDIAFNDGNLYVSGSAKTGFVHVGNSYQSTYNGGSFDGVLMKLNTDGIPEWSTYYGASGYDISHSIAANATDVYLVSQIGNGGANLSTSGVYDETENGSDDVVLTRFDIAGNRIWATYYGGSNNDRPNGLALINNELVINGRTNSTDLPVSPGVFQTTLGGDYDIVYAVFDLNGQFSRATYLGGTGWDLANQSGVMSQLNDYIITGTVESDVVNTPGLNQFAGLGDQSFVGRLSFDLTSLNATHIGLGTGQPSDENAYGVDLAPDGTIWAVGYTNYTAGIATPDGYRTTPPVSASFNQDGYLVQLSSDLTTIEYGTYIGQTSVNPANSNGTEIIKQVICLGNNIFIGGRVYGTQEAFGAGNISTVGAYDENHDLAPGLYGDHELFMMKFCGNYVEVLEGDTVEVCAGTPVTVTGESGWETYDWAGPETSTLETWNPATTGQYILTATDLYSCESKDTIEVIINPTPTPTVLSSNGTELCSTGASTDLSTSTPYTNYLWPDASTAPTFTVNTTGTYAVTVTDDNGCTGTGDITITELTFDFTVNGDTSFCGLAPSPVEMIATGGGTYAWSTSESTPSITVTPSTTTTYDVTITNGACVENFSQTIVVGSDPIVDLGPDVTAQPGDQVTFSVPTGYSDYVWTPSTDFSCQNCAMSDLSVNGPTEVIVVVTDANGCTGTDTAQVIVSTFTIPSGFSPNGDGINDSFVIPGIETSNAELTVWNRWGGKVFESSNYQNEWGASCQGSGCLGGGIVPEGTYFYAFVIGDQKFEGYLTIKK